MRSEFLLAVLGATALDAIAADDVLHEHEHPHHIPEIVVSADPLGAVDNRLVAPVTVMDGKALRSASMRSLGETVANELGVSSSDFGASVGRPVIRGLGGARVRVLDDGIGTMDLSTISADHGVAVESVLAEQIEIFRGPATLLYGSGASGGLVNVASGRILDYVPERPEGSLYGHYDTASDGWLGAFRLDGGAGPLALHLDGLRRDTGDLEIPGFAELNPEADERPGILPNSDAEADRLSAGASLVGERGHAGFTVSTFASDYGVPGGHHHEEPGEPEPPPGAGTRIDQAQLRYDVEAAWDARLGLLERVRTRWGYSDYEHDEVEASGEVGTRFSNEQWEGRVELVHRPLGAFDGVLGIQLHDRDFSAFGEEAFVPPAEQDAIAVFLLEKADFGPVHFDAGVRFETQTARRKNAGGDVDHDVVSVSGGAVWAYRDGYELGFHGTRAERAPAIEELFAGGPHLASNTFEIGDASLDEETSVNVDIFWRRTAGRWRFDLTFFYNDIEDFVFQAFNDRNGDGIADRVEEDFLDTGLVVDEDDALLLVNQAQTDATFWGFELESRLTVFEDARGRLEARVWSDYVESDLGGGERAPRIPPLRFGGGFEWERGPAYAGLTVVRVTDKDDTALLETDTDGYTLLGVHAGYTWTVRGLSELTVFARGTNLADEQARRHTSFVKDLATLPGISGTFGVRARF